MSSVGSMLDSDDILASSDSDGSFLTGDALVRVVISQEMSPDSDNQ